MTQRSAVAERICTPQIAQPERRLSDLLFPRASDDDSTADRFVAFLRSALALTVATTLLFHLLVTARGVLLARLLGPTARGEFGTVIFYAQAFTFVGLLGAQLAIARRSARSPKTAPRLARASVRMGLLTGVAAMVVVAILTVLTLPQSKRHLIPLCLLATCVLPLQHVRLSLLAVDHGTGSFGRYNVNRLLFAGLFPLMLFCAWLFDFVSLRLVVVLAVVQSALALGALLAWRSESPFFGPHAPRVPSLLREGLPYALATGAATLFEELDIYAVLLMADSATQGQYLAAVPVAHLLIIVPNALALFAFRRGARFGSTLSASHVVRLGVILVALQCACALGLILLSRLLIQTFYGDAFAQAATLAAALVPAYAVGGVAIVGDAYLRARQRSMVGVWSRLIGAALLAIVAILLYPRLAIYSLPWAALAGHTANALLIGAALLWQRDSNDTRPSPHVE